MDQTLTEIFEFHEVSRGVSCISSMLKEATYHPQPFAYVIAIVVCIGKLSDASACSTGVDMEFAQDFTILVEFGIFEAYMHTSVGRESCKWRPLTGLEVAKNDF